MPKRKEVKEVIVNPELVDESLREIVEVIQTQHWDMAACPCWVCVKGRNSGCRPRSMYLPRNIRSDPIRLPVHVDSGEITYVPVRKPAQPPRCSKRLDAQINGLPIICVENINHHGYHKSLVDGKEVTWLA